MKKGKFIVIEGTDGSGKGTQTDLLFEKLKADRLVEKIDFPRYGNFSAYFVEKYLRGEYGEAKDVSAKQASMFYALDRYDASFEMKKHLKEGKWLISNRYATSNMGHQAGKIKDPKEREEFLNWLNEIEFGIFQIPVPDVVIFLYTPPEIGQKLVDQKGTREYVGGEKRDIHEADLEHLKDASNAYLEVADRFGWHRIDCAPNGEMRSREDIHNEILVLINGL